MRFGEAIEKARKGMKIARRAWRGTCMYVYVVESHFIPVDVWKAMMPSQEPTEAEKELGSVFVDEHFDMMTKRGSRLIGWTPSLSDMMSDDWYVVKEGEQ